MQFVHQQKITELSALTDLINQAYRGTTGSMRWTTEAHIVEGERISALALKELIADEQYDFISLYQNDELRGCISIHYLDDIAEFGTFAILPIYHGQGLGKQLLDYAEQHAQKQCQHFQVSVVNLNQNLINFYLRRGYQPMNEERPYPIHAQVGTPKVNDIALTILQKYSSSI